MKSVLAAGLTCLAFASPALCKECYEGVATINQAQSGNNCTLEEKGYYNASAGPLTHAGCTAAKADARQKLAARVQESCVPYIQSNAPCSVIELDSC